jgi:hypothetical protein
VFGRKFGERREVGVCIWRKVRKRESIFWKVEERRRQFMESRGEGLSDRGKDFCEREVERSV